MVMWTVTLLISRDACWESVEGFSGAVFRGFRTFAEAITFVADNAVRGPRKTAERHDKQGENQNSGSRQTLTTAGQRNRDTHACLQSPLERPITEVTPTLTLPKVTEQRTRSGDTYPNID